ncbi:MAG: hypothetical protein R3C02_02570 [Planctomycetaceae bacterium]
MNKKQLLKLGRSRGLRDVSRGWDPGGCPRQPVERLKAKKVISSIPAAAPENI